MRAAPGRKPPRSGGDRRSRGSGSPGGALDAPDELDEPLDQDDDLFRSLARARPKRDAAPVRLEAIPAVEIRALLETSKRPEPPSVDTAREIHRVPGSAVRLLLPAQRAELDRDELGRAHDRRILHENLPLHRVASRAPDS